MQNKRPLFSIIIPTYNRALKLRRAIESIDRQSFRDFEVFVCDDGSTDETKEIVASFNDRLKMTYLYEENWGGPARPRNNGLHSAHGDWICFLDADDWWFPEKLEIASRYLADSDLVFHDLDIHPTRFWRLIGKIRGRHLHHPVFSNLMLKANPIPTSSVLIRRSILDRAGSFSEDKTLIGMEDFDLWLKIARITERFTYIPQSLGAYWTGEDNLSKVSERQIARYTAIHDRHVSYLPPDEQTQAGMLLQYSIARIKQQLGLFEEAQSHFRTSSHIRHLRWKLMSRAMLALLRCKSFLPHSWIRI